MNYSIIYVLKYRGKDISFDLYTGINFVTLLFEVYVLHFLCTILDFSLYIGLM